MRYPVFFILFSGIISGVFGNGFPVNYSNWHFKKSFTVYHGAGFSQADAAALCSGRVPVGRVVASAPGENLKFFGENE